MSADEKNQLVDVNAWLKLSWHDYSLEWNPKDYDGVSDLRFKKSQLWTPDVLLYNSADPQFDSSFQSNVLVYPDGMVNWIPPGIFRISCRIAVAWFPFDEQECFLKEVAVATNRHKARSRCQAWGTRRKEYDLVLLMLRRLFLQ
nr:Neurotransmitter-gated ion-channel ligand-binding domain containing protein [Haemonchus contortus]